MFIRSYRNNSPTIIVSNDNNAWCIFFRNVQSTLNVILTIIIQIYTHNDVDKLGICQSVWCSGTRRWNLESILGKYVDNLLNCCWCTAGSNRVHKVFGVLIGNGEIDCEIGAQTGELFFQSTEFGLNVTYAIRNSIIIAYSGCWNAQVLRHNNQNCTSVGR